MSARFNLQPDPRFEPLKDGLRERVKAAANASGAETFGDVLDPTMRSIVNAGFDAAGAHEGMIWLAERSDDSAGEVDSALSLAYNTGP